MHTDNELEYLNEWFNDLHRKSGIGRHLAVPRTPQQNGLAERFNRTILDKVRCMLSNANLPKTFWGETVNTAAYLINQCPSTTLNFKTPQEVWTGKPPSLNHLRVFGCAAFEHIK